MADISRLVRMAVYNRLSDAEIGFNAQYAAIQQAYGTDDIVIDFGPDAEEDATRNFGWGAIPADLIEGSSAFEYPMLCIGADVGRQDPAQQRIKFMRFSGQVIATILVHVSWDESQITDFDTWPDAVIDAMYSSINNPQLPNNWGAGVLFNGDLDWAKGPILMAGRHWRRTIRFQAIFTVIIP